MIHMLTNINRLQQEGKRVQRIYSQVVAQIWIEICHIKRVSGLSTRR